ncbi:MULTISPECIES: inositol monophosphatase family protein [Hyphomonas]|uniref:inositol monophosphatase family protein n=1 Tax=Hyphomonas TaxID=85 RepID=UPI000C4E04B0|nr:inositol monophosphatase family protein [Hyphomonas adhaerens]MBB41282.1 myo-inositol-1-monophosphatase [Hyphomonas sp.]
MYSGTAALEPLERIMQEASDLALSWTRRREALVVDEKSAGQFASSADLDVEAMLRRCLAEEFGDGRIIGEEMGGDLGEGITGWALDPIDGTSNFLLGLPLWGISAGYIEKGGSALGAIALPELGLLLSAASGTGLRVNRIAQPRAASRGPVKIMALGENDFEPGPETDARAQTFRDQGYAVVRYRCAVFSLASAALGRLGGYVERGCGLWDVAAADIICREAGMSVEAGQIAPGRYGIDARWA